MTLAALIRKREPRKVATAIPAISATQHIETGGTVARIATVAVAKPKGATPVTSVVVAKSADDETVIRSWLLRIGESDEVMIAECLHRCATDMDARGYYLRRADELPQQDADDDRITCSQCLSFINERCYKPSEGKPWRPAPLPRRCARFKPRAGEFDQLTGRERWPNL